MSSPRSRSCKARLLELREAALHRHVLDIAEVLECEVGHRHESCPHAGNLARAPKRSRVGVRSASTCVRPMSSTSSRRAADGVRAAAPRSRAGARRAEGGRARRPSPRRARRRRRHTRRRSPLARSSAHTRSQRPGKVGAGDRAADGEGDLVRPGCRHRSVRPADAGNSASGVRARDCATRPSSRTSSAELEALVRAAGGQRARELREVREAVGRERREVLAELADEVVTARVLVRRDSRSPRHSSKLNAPM